MAHRDVGDVGLPRGIAACLFDLDGVLTKTATVHAAAWREMFDDYLRGRAERTGEPFVPFDPVKDYDEYVDGRPRGDGVRGFLASRGITLPEGDEHDPPTAETVHSLGERKNNLVLAKIAQHGVDTYPGSVRYLRAVRSAGLHTAVVSSSSNTREVIEVTGLEAFLDARIDGLTAERDHLPGKPAPDVYLAGAQAVGVAPAAAAVFEDSLAGVTAGRAGQFGFVVGVDRVGQAAELRAHGADTVVTDLAQLLADDR